MATTGSKNLEKNWRGSNKPSAVKKTSLYYEKVGMGYKQLGFLQRGTDIVYIDNMTTSAAKAAIKISGGSEIYYTSIDNLIKPNSAAASAVPLDPSSFGLSNRTFQSVEAYYQEIQRGINSRSDIPGELFDYLYELLDYAKNGTGDYSGIDKTSFPWGQIENYYAEVIGPIACIRRGILNNIIPPNKLTGAKIFIPGYGEKLYDYKIISGKSEYLLSAKSGRGVSNQVKPQFVIESVNSNTSYNQIQNTKEYQLLQILSDMTVVSGAFYGWQSIQENNELSSEAIQSVLSVYRGDAHNVKLPEPELFKPFVNLHMRQYISMMGNITVGEVRYKCEQLIQEWSKRMPQNRILKDIFSIYLNESRVIYVKLLINKITGNPYFDAFSGGQTNIINDLYLRSSNYATRTADRIGFQVK